MTSFAKLKQELLTRSGRGAKYGLERIGAALEAIDHPQRGLPAIHVSGTNGKGSVCAMVEAMGRAAGLRTGMFTSPHLCDLAERIRIDGEPIEDAPFAAALELALRHQVTFFEVMTIAGFIAMRDAQVDMAIFEVGLGGRLDATNMLEQPWCTAIATVARDHIKILGPELTDIAREKAGICKPDAPVVIGAVGDAERAAILERTAAVGAEPVWALLPPAARGRADLAAIEPITVSTDNLIATPEGVVSCDRLALSGTHQRDNAAVAVGIAHLFARRLPAEQARRLIDRATLERGLATTRWPGRLERLQRDGVTILLDCAHNLHGATALAQALEGMDPATTSLVFGAMNDKRWSMMLDVLGPHAHRRIYCEPIVHVGTRDPAPPPELAAQLNGDIADSPAAAIEQALAQASAGDTIVVAGSIFLVGAVRTTLLELEPDIVLSM